MTVSLTVHRGSAQIGGTCLEIAHESGVRLILDAGRPLDAARGAQGLLPATLETDCPATVLICHAHQDHWGLLHEMPANWPVWTGPISARLIGLGYGIEGRELSQTVYTWTYRKPFQIGPFTVTAWLTDHSAPDAAMLLVEAEGKRIFYTGDFRIHGRKAELVSGLMTRPPRDIDLMIIEGTNLGSGKPTVSESALEDRFVDLIRATRGRVFVYWSAQNIDRTVTLFRAARRTALHVDLYAAEVLDLVAPGTAIPRIVPDFPEITLVVTSGQRRVRARTPASAATTDALIERCKSSGQAISGPCPG